jgi:hypothetical protein
LRRDIFLALALLAAACGDDSSGDDNLSKDDDSGSDETPRDAGRDSSQQTTPDSGTDAATQSAELTEAQKTDGVVATQARADLLIEAVCRKAPDCAGVSQMVCAAGYEEGWMNLVDNDASDACKDAELDLIACASSVGCDEIDTCDSFKEQVEPACPDDAGM